MGRKGKAAGASSDGEEKSEKTSSSEKANGHYRDR